MVDLSKERMKGKLIPLTDDVKQSILLIHSIAVRWINSIRAANERERCRRSHYCGLLG